MKKILKITGIVLASFIAVLYLAFLFILPRVVKLEPYVKQIQDIVKASARLDLSIENAKVITLPNLSAGVELLGVSVNLPDGSRILSTDKIRLGLSVPAIFKLDAKFTKAEIDNLDITAEIKDGKQYKILLVIQDIINDKKRAEGEKKIDEPSIWERIQEKYNWFNPEWIVINVPDLRINNYKIKVDDILNKHYLLLIGERLDAGYSGTVIQTKQRASLKTNAQIFSDEDKNITANIDWKTFLPDISHVKDTEDDPAEFVEFPFVNPVSTYRMYNFKSNINSKLKVKKHNDEILAKGNLDIENILMDVKGLSLPSGYINILADGSNADISTDFYVAKDENISVDARVNFGKKKYIDAKINTDKIYINDLILLAKGILNTMQVRNNLDDFVAGGFIQANTNIVTDFKKLRSNGGIIARDGFLANKKVGKLFDRGNLNFIFADNKFLVSKSQIYVENSPIKFSGMIDDTANVDFAVKSDRIPLTVAYNTLAPKSIKNKYVLNSGNASIDFDIHGALNAAVAKLKLLVTDLNFKEKNNLFNIANKHLNIGAYYDFKNIEGKITNSDLNFTLPKTGSAVKIPNVIVRINSSDIKTDDIKVKINQMSEINLNAKVTDYATNPEIDVIADGGMFTGDILHFLDRNLWSYFDVKGSVPVKFSYKGNPKRCEMLAQAFADSGNYITPVIIKNIENKPAILQSKIIFKKNRLNIKDTGLFEGTKDSLITRPIVTLGGTVVNLNTKEPFINILRINIPQELMASIYKLKNSSLNINGKLTAFGNSLSPVIRGNFSINKINFPELLTTLDDLNLRVVNKEVTFRVINLRLNRNSDVNVRGIANLNRLPNVFINNVMANSHNIDLDKALIVAQNAGKVFAPDYPSDKSADKEVKTESPIVLRDGRLDFRHIKTGDILLDDTKGTFDFVNNIFDLKEFITTIFEGKVHGRVAADLNDMAINVNAKGSDINTNTALIQLAKMKDTVSGKLNFDSEISFKALDYDEMIKSLNGDINFEIGKGQFGAFGKFENFLLAENIRESEFFKTTIGSMMSSLVTIDTTHYDNITGNIKLIDGIVKILPVKTLGNVMNLYVFGDYDILENYTDLKVRGRLASMMSNVLGPIGQLNPVNVVKATPGVNYVMLKAFSLFCETVTQDEMNAIPSFEKDYDNASATKFQIVVKGKDIKVSSMVKSFKWLAVAEEMAQAQAFMDSLPPPTVDENGNAVLSAPEPPKAKSPLSKLKSLFKKEN